MIETGLKDKVVIVTGGAAGIGLAVARRFAREGSPVAVWDVQQEAGEAAVSTLTADGGTAAFWKVDVTDGPAVDAATNDVAARWGGIDVMVANAGIVRDGQLVKWKDGELAGRMEEPTFDSVIGVNLKGVYLCGRAATPHLIRRGGGSILVASSVVGLYGNFGQTNYSATKAGVIAMTKTWARELGRYGIRVNAIAPGFIGTEILRAMPEKVIETMVKRTPIPRLGTPEEVAEAYVWLASDAASFVHGTVLSVDGGLVPGT
jgi:3-oxoacyl-[acyl-carrier protein] reductase